MWSPASPACDENLIPATQTFVHRKSVGRTPLKALGVLDPNCLSKDRLSLPKSSNPILQDKESSLGCAGIPVGIWVDPSPDDYLASSSKRLSSSLKNKGLKVNVKDSSLNIKANCSFSQPDKSALLPDLVLSGQTQEETLQPDIKCLEGFNTFVGSASVAGDETSATDGQLDVSADVLVKTTFDVCSKSSAVIPLETSADEESFLHEVNTKSSLNNHAPCSIIVTEDEECPKVNGNTAIISESNPMFSADNTFEINSNFDGNLPFSEVISDLIQEVENWGIVGKEDEENAPTDVWDLQTKDMVPSLLADPANEDKPGQVVDVSSAFVDSQVLNELDSIVSHVIVGEGCFPASINPSPAKTIAMHDDSACSFEIGTENDLDGRKSADKCFFPIERSTPHSELNEIDSTKVDHTEWLTPSSRLHQTGRSVSASHTQKGDDFAASSQSGCPTPVIPPQFRLPKVLSLGGCVSSNIISEALVSLHEAGTSMTPVSTTEEVTWTTPVMLLNKSINTSWNMTGNGIKSAKDNAAETDSLLWNFSKESFCNASREELIRRLEGTLIVVEVLSRQLQDWQQQSVASKPSEQREASTQTFGTYGSEGSYTCETASMVKCAENLCEKVQKHGADLNHQADECLKDLEVHSSTVIAQLRRDLETERKICDTVREAYEQQSSYNKELEEFVHRARSVCSEVEDDRKQLLVQCSQSRELMSQHWRLFTVMKEKTRMALEEYDGIRNERDKAMLENEEMFSCLEVQKSSNEQLKLENSRLGTELESLMERLCSLESEIDQWKEDNSELGEQLSAKDSSMKLLEKELNEATARGQIFQDRIKYLHGEVVPSLELKLSEVFSEKEALQAQLQALEKEHSSQIFFYTESLEFLEQENHVCREQVTETESQLKTHHLNLLERNYQCENLKDTIKTLEKDVCELKQRLADAENEAQSMKTKTAKETYNHSSEISKIKTRLLDLFRNLKESSQSEVKCHSYELRTPGGSLTFSNTFAEESIRTTILDSTDSEDVKAEVIWSETSAFTVVQPLTSPSEGTPAVNLTDLLHEISSVVSDVITASSCAMNTKQDLISNFKMEISNLKEELHNEKYQHKSDVRDLQEVVDMLKRRTDTLDEKLTSKEKHIRGLQEMVNQHEQKILLQLTKMNEGEDVAQENSKLKISLKQHINEVEVLKRMLTQKSNNTERNWIEEKLMMHKDLTALSIKLADTEYSKSEAVQRLMRHKDILMENLARSEAEVKKLDDIIEKIREALLSLPDLVNRSDTLKQLLELLN